jgi:hypothetical protein
VPPLEAAPLVAVVVGCRPKLEPRTTCHPRYSRTNRTTKSQTCGHWGACCTSCAHCGCPLGAMTSRTCPGRCRCVGAHENTAHGLVQFHTLRNWVAWLTLWWCCDPVSRQSGMYPRIPAHFSPELEDIVKQLLQQVCGLRE